MVDAGTLTMQRPPSAAPARRRYRLCYSYFVFEAITVVYSVALVIYGAAFASYAGPPVAAGLTCIMFGLFSMRWMWKTYRMPETEWVRRGIAKFPNNVCPLHSPCVCRSHCPSTHGSAQMLRDEVPKVADLYKEAVRRYQVAKAAGERVEQAKAWLDECEEDYNSYSFYRVPLVLHLYLLLPPAIGSAVAITWFLVAQIVVTEDAHDAVDLGLSILPFACFVPHLWSALWLPDIELQQKGYVQRNKPELKSPHNNDSEWFRTYVCAECRPSLWGKNYADKTNIWFDPSKLLTQPVGVDRVRVDSSLARANLDAVHVPILTSEAFAQLRR